MQGHMLEKKRLNIFLTLKHMRLFVFFFFFLRTESIGILYTFLNAPMETNSLAWIDESLNGLNIDARKKIMIYMLFLNEKYSKIRQVRVPFCLGYFFVVPNTISLISAFFLCCAHFKV